MSSVRTAALGGRLHFIGYLIRIRASVCQQAPPGAHQLLQWKHKLACLDFGGKNGSPVGGDDESSTLMAGGDFGFGEEQ